MSTAARRCLSLAKGKQRYVFWYHEGQENELLAALVDLADARHVEFDWFDAAVLSYQMGKSNGSETVPAATGGACFSEQKG